MDLIKRSLYVNDSIMCEDQKLFILGAWDSPPKEIPMNLIWHVTQGVGIYKIFPGRFSCVAKLENQVIEDW